MKRLVVIFGILIAMLAMTVGTALGVRTYGGHTFDAKDPYCYYNSAGEPRIYTGATIQGSDPRIFTYNKRLMVTYDTVHWYEIGTTQTYQAAGGYENIHWWHGLPALRYDTYLYMTQIKLSHESWAQADRSAGKWISCP